MNPAQKERNRHPSHYKTLVEKKENSNNIKKANPRERVGGGGRGRKWQEEPHGLKKTSMKEGKLNAPMNHMINEVSYLACAYQNTTDLRHLRDLVLNSFKLHLKVLITLEYCS